MKLLSLNIRISLLIILSSAVLVTGMLLTVHRLVEADYVSLVAERETAKIDGLAAQLALYQQQRLLSLQSLAAQLLDEQEQLLPAEALLALLNNPSLMAYSLFPDGMLIFDADATAIVETHFVPNRLGTNYQDRPHFQRVIQTKEAVISEPILGRATGLPLLSYLYPILSRQGQLLGYLGGILDLSNTPLLPEEDALFFDDDINTLVIDPKNRLFVSMQERFTTPKSLPEPGVDALVDAAVAQSPAGTLVSYDNGRYLLTTKELPGLGWVVLRAIPYSKAVAPARESFSRFVSVALAVMLLVAVAGFWAARSLTRPIAAMTSRINHMATDARLDNDFDGEGGPEIQALASAMNRLAEERNASERAVRDTERFLSSVLEAASEIAIIATDVHGLVTVFNHGAEAMLGYSKVDMVGVQTPSVLHLTEEVQARGEELSAQLGTTIAGFDVFVHQARSQGSETREWTYVHKSGRRIPVSVMVTSMRDDNGDLSGFLGVAEDISERKRMDQMKAEFVSTVSHELRTPLTSISGALGLVVGGGLGALPEPITRLLATAYRNSQRLALLINDVLDIEKIASGKLHFDLQVVPLIPLLQQALDAIRSYGSDRGVTLALVEPEEALWVRVDSQRLMQVLANLLSNAIKFSPDKGLVSLSLALSANKVVVSVTDQGIGIADAFRSRIFQRFAQADSSDTRAKDGTGLGLAITRELIERMGGRVDFESTFGQGSRFFFELPLQSSSVPPTPADLTLPVAAHASAAARILLIEDDPQIAQRLASLLGDAGYQVESVTKAEDAFSCLEGRAYDLICVDATPEIDALQWLQRLRSQSHLKSVPVLLLSSTLDQGDLAIEGDLSHIEWLAKPIDPQQLVALVQRLLVADGAPRQRVLHIEDDLDLHAVVAAITEQHCQFVVCHRISDARVRLAQETFDVILLDIALPDGMGWELLPDIRLHQPHARVVILSGTDVSERDRKRVEAVLTKSRLTTDELLRAIDSRLQSE